VLLPFLFIQGMVRTKYIYIEREFTFINCSPSKFLVYCNSSLKVCVKDVEVHRNFVEIKFASSFGLFSLLFEFKSFIKFVIIKAKE
jgi:hypothetical protein